MAEEDEDLKLGRSIAAGDKRSQTPASADPDLQRGQQVTQPLRDTMPAPPATTADAPPADSSTAPSWTWRGMARNVAAVPWDVGANLVNFASDPAGHIIAPLLAAGGSAYDFAAPYFGGSRLTPEFRAMLAGNDPTASNPGTTIEKAVIGDVAGTPAEQTVRNALGAAGTAAAMGPSGAAPWLAGGGASLAAQAAGSQVADWAKPAVELAAGALGAKIATGAANVGTRVVAGGKTPLAESFERLGIDKPLVGDVSGSPTLQTLQAYGSKAPGAVGRVVPAAQRTVGQFESAVEDTASRLGQSQTAQAAGDVLQTEARNWKDVVFPAREQAAWAPVDRAMATATVDPANYRQALSSLTAKLSALPETQKQLLPPKTQALLDAINVDVPAGQTMTWQQAQNLRTAIGKVMGVPEIVQSVGKDQLKAAYGGISEDMRTSAAANNALPAFNAANKVSTDGHAFIDGTLSKIVKANNPAQESITPETAAKTMIGSGDTTLQALRAEMPMAADELAAWKLRDMRLATPGKAGATGDETSIDSFLTDLNRMRQAAPGGFGALYSDPAVRQRIADLATVGDAVKDTARLVNYSHTGPYVAFAQAATPVVTALQAGVSPLWALATGAAPFAANYGIGRYVTSPTVARIASAPGPRATMNPLAAALIAQLAQQR